MGNQRDIYPVGIHYLRLDPRILFPMISRLRLRKSFCEAKSQNLQSNLGIESEIGRLWNIPDHQHGIRCKAPRSDD